MDIFDLSAKITLDSSQYEKGIEKAKRHAHDYRKNWESTAKGIGKSLKTAAGVATKAFAAIGAAAGTAAGFMVKTGMQYNSQMESYTSNFKVMLGSTEKAVERVEQLKVMAAKTPFAMDDLANATQTLLSFQVPAEQTNEILQMLGDVSLGNKEKLKGLALVFGQVSSAGKLSGQDLMQFNYYGLAA